MVKDVQRLVSTDWLDDRLGSENLKVLDASWYLPSEERDPKKEFEEKHILGSKFFDINSFSDPDHKLPHMVPSAEKFCFELSKLGVSDADHVVFYDGLGIFSSARAWWLFKYFGFCQVSVLNGGLPKWIAENRALTSEPSSINSSSFIPSVDLKLVCDWRKVKSFQTNKPKQVIDARPSERFSGKVPEPRPGLRSGHIPGSTNICYKDLLNDNHTLKKNKELLEIIHSKGIDLQLPIITSCGSGVTAAILFLALEELGVKDLAIYDGSWAEWGSRNDLEIEIG